MADGGNDREARARRGWSAYLHLCRFRILLASLLLLLAAVPLAVTRSVPGLAVDIALNLVLLSGILSMRRERALLGVALLLGVPALVSRWVVALLPSGSPDLLTVLVPVSFFAFFTVFLLRAVVTADTVTGDVIAGALSVYLLLGLTWSFVYQAVAMVDPGAFSLGAAFAAAGPADWNDWIYYSFITLATVGYGDITAVAPSAQFFAYAEAVTGVLYVAVLVAQLVSAYQRPPRPPR
ncbi:MAG: two pore domain potassium channel family protein [Methanospirillum sp.]|nr:two pore domain potassium channel family protein [Methanospirillum sp.]